VYLVKKNLVKYLDKVLKPQKNVSKFLKILIKMLEIDSDKKNPNKLFRVYENISFFRKIDLPLEKWENLENSQHSC